MERLIHIFLRHHKAILVLSLGAVASLLFFLPRFQLYSNDPVIYPGPDDPERKYLEHVQDIFGGTDTIIVGLQAPNVFNPDTLDKIRRLTEALEKLNGVDSVYSLSNARVVETQDGTLTSRNLFEEIPRTDEEMKMIRRAVSDNRLLKNRLASEDGTIAVLTVSLVKGITGENNRSICREIRKLAYSEQGPEKILLTGPSIVNTESERVSMNDMKRMLPIITLLTLIILLVNFGDVINMLAGFFTIFLGIASTFGAMALLKIPLTILTAVLPTILMVTGISYTLYLLSEFYSQSRDNPGADRAVIVSEVLRQVWVAVLLCSFTTIVGFASLCTSKILAIRQMGIAASVGTCIMLVVNLMTLSAALFYLRSPSPRKQATVKHRDLLDRVLASIHHFAVAKNKWVLACMIVAFGTGFVGMTRMVSETDGSKLFNKGSPIRDDLDIVTRTLHGATFFDLILEGKQPDHFKDPALLTRLDELQTALNSHSKVGQTLSVNDFLKKTNRLLHDDLSSAEVVPGTREETAQYLLIYQFADKNRELSHYLSESGDVTRMLIRADISRTREALAFIDDAEKTCRQILPKDVSCRMTGETVLGPRAAQEVTSGMLRGFLSGVLVISVSLVLVFRSFKIGFIAMVPNVLPIIMSLGFMGWSSFPFDIGTSLMAPMVIGMTVDDTIRFFVRFFFELRQTNHFLIRRYSKVRVTEEQKFALTRSFDEVSRPMVLASLIILFGFGSLGLSSFVPIERLGWLTAFTMFVCVFGDLLLLPAILSLIKI